MNKLIFFPAFEYISRMKNIEVGWANELCVNARTNHAL